jgi:hypothetical protein
MHWLADTVLVIHFGVAAFIALGLLLIPIGRLRAWHWVRHRRLRILHAGLMVFVALEALVGMTCPLTRLEAYLRGTQAHESFWAEQISRLLFWHLPLSFFLILYLACAAWVIWLWFFCRPRPK